MHLIFIDEYGDDAEEVPVSSSVDPIDAGEPTPYPGGPE